MLTKNSPCSQLPIVVLLLSHILSNLCLLRILRLCNVPTSHIENHYSYHLHVVMNTCFDGCSIFAYMAKLTSPFCYLNIPDTGPHARARARGSNFAAYNLSKALTSQTVLRLMTFARESSHVSTSHTTQFFIFPSIFDEIYIR